MRHYLVSRIICEWITLNELIYIKVSYNSLYVMSKKDLQCILMFLLKLNADTLAHESEHIVKVNFHLYSDCKILIRPIFNCTLIVTYCREHLNLIGYQ